jgi:hypothetical protein
MRVIPCKKQIRRMMAHCLVPAALMGVAVNAVALESMADAEMAAATGQEGIGLQMELRINADQYGRALTASSVGNDRPLIAANSANFANCGSTTNFSSTGCRLALKFANQNNGGGEWLVAKNFYGRIVMPLIHVDSGVTPSAATSYVDLSRFKDKNGVPLLASPNNIPVVNISYPKEIEVWNLTIGGLSMEHGADGYLKNDGGSVGGLRISNSVPDMPATISLQGSIGIFGF